MNLSSENESSFEGYDKAARIIQKAWKNYLDICVFSHFRNLIYIRRQGDPHQLLKYIDPKEAELIDAASGINIRFRLGGEKFPPCIYYKIFTHRNIVDLCANSPRDYVNVIPKRLAHLPFFKNLKDDHRGWYQRVENNGWRLVSKRFWRASDEITEEGNRQKVNFPFSKMMRKQDFEKRRKYKKIQWMREMYVNNWKSIATSNSSANLQGFRFETIWNQAANKNYSPSTIEAKEKQEKLKKLIEES